MASWYHLHLQPDCQYFSVKMKAFRLGILPRLCGDYLGIPHYPTQFNTWQVPSRFNQFSPGISTQISRFPGFLWGFGSELLVIWYSIHLGPPVMAPAGGRLDGKIWEDYGDMKGSGWFGNDDYCMLFFYMMCIYIYIYVYMRYMHIQILPFFFEYLVVHIFIYNLYFVYRYLYFKGKLYLNFKGFFGVEAMDLSCFEWCLDCQSIGNLMFFWFKQGVGLSYQVQWLGSSYVFHLNPTCDDLLLELRRMLFVLRGDSCLGHTGMLVLMCLLLGHAAKLPYKQDFEQQYMISRKKMWRQLKINYSCGFPCHSI